MIIIIIVIVYKCDLLYCYSLYSTLMQILYSVQLYSLLVQLKYICITMSSSVFSMSMAINVSLIFGEQQAIEKLNSPDFTKRMRPILPYCDNTTEEMGDNVY